MGHSIDREKVIAALHCRAYDDDFPCWKCAYYKQDEKPVARCDYRGLMDDAIALLKEQEAVVRCKDCKHWYFADNRIPSEQENVCGRNGIIVTPDWYCADGERKDE
jgi:hypothetical protein